MKTPPFAIGGPSVCEGDYLGDDGLLRCGKCGGPKQVRVAFAGRLIEPVCLCRCEKEALAAEESRLKKSQRDRRLLSSPAAALSINYDRNATFNLGTDVSRAEYLVRTFARAWPQMAAEGHGLALIGPVGTGKTYAAAALANAVCAQGSSVLFTSVPRVEAALWDAKGRSRVSLLDSLALFDLLIIDDLGCERATDYMDEQAFVVVDERYRSGKPLVTTTNIPLRELKNPDALSRLRIYDRVLERCQPIIFDGDSWRPRIAEQRRARLLAAFDEVERKD